MGRAKLNMELISKEKSRNITFKKRKEGLMRKMHEFTTLCDVSACIIIYGPAAAEPEIWPSNPDEVRRIIDIYKAKSKDSGNKAFCLNDFFHDRKRRIEDELAKLRKKNMEAKYPTWLDFMNFKTEAQLRDFAAALNGKAEYVRSRIEFLKRNKQDQQHQQQQINMMDFSHARLQSPSQFYSPAAAVGMRGIELEMMHHHGGGGGGMEELQVQQNSMVMAALLNDHRMQYGGGNIQCASYKRQVYYETAVDPAVISQRPLARYYAPPMGPPQPQPLPYLVMPAGVQLQFSTRESAHDEGGGEGEDIVQYQRYFE